MPSSKAQSGTLYVVATPIGNLGDLTRRAGQVLGEAQRVFCEDTRRTRELLNHLGLQTPTTRLDAHANDRQLEEVVEELRQGRVFAIVSDAGTPSVADPGARLVSLARSAGAVVTPIPGASAVAALVSILGASSRGEEANPTFVFSGFFPREKRSTEAERFRSGVALGLLRWIWFESPHRIATTLGELSDELGQSVRCVAAKELTKMHECVWDGPLPDVARDVVSEIEAKGSLGEWCFALVGQEGDIVEKEPNSLEWERALKCLLVANVGPSEASRAVSQEFGARKRDVYERALSLSGKK